MGTLVPSGFRIVNLPIGYIESGLESIGDSVLDFMPKLDLVARFLTIFLCHPILELKLALWRRRGFIHEGKSALAGLQSLCGGQNPRDEHK